MGKEMGPLLSKDREHGEDIVLGLPRQRSRYPRGAALLGARPTS